MSYPVIDIEGIGPVYAERLHVAGIRTTGDLLERAKDPKGREALGAETGIEHKRIMKWAKMADLMRIRGVAEEYSELLEAAGVDTVKELKHRVPANLTAKMAEVNAVKKLVRQVPSETMVARWIEEAKQLPAILTY